MTLSALVAVRSAAVLDNVGCIVLCIGIMMSVWANDSFAYLVGSRFGKHKMVPKISPKKSWEGFRGGHCRFRRDVGCSCCFFPKRTSPRWSPSHAASSAVSRGSSDVVESRIKRGAGVKDSGNMIPGHGGLLDRSDSMLFVAITAYFLLRIMRVIV